MFKKIILFITALSINGFAYAAPCKFHHVDFMGDDYYTLDNNFDLNKDEANIYFRTSKLIEKTNEPKPKFEMPWEHGQKKGDDKKTPNTVDRLGVECLSPSDPGCINMWRKDPESDTRRDRSYLKRSRSACENYQSKCKN